MKTRKRKKRTGSSLSTAIICAVSVCLLSAAIPARGEQGQTRQYALVAGTVFQESGLSLRGAEILLVPNQQDAKAYKLKKSEAISDARGEFEFRVPAQPARYTIKVKRKGFVAQEKPVEVKADERIDVNFQLEPAS
jgi:Carboxypeptidase regulatory-like domain